MYHYIKVSQIIKALKELWCCTKCVLLLAGCLQFYPTSVSLRCSAAAANWMKYSHDHKSSQRQQLLLSTRSSLNEQSKDSHTRDSTHSTHSTDTQKLNKLIVRRAHLHCASLCCSSTLKHTCFSGCVRRLLTQSVRLCSVVSSPHRGGESVAPHSQNVNVSVMVFVSARVCVSWVCVCWRGKVLLLLLSSRAVIWMNENSNREGHT